MPTLHVVTRCHGTAAGITRHWVDVVALPGDRTALTAGAIAMTVPHARDLVGWLASESRARALHDRPPAETLVQLGAMLDASAAHTAAAAYLVHDAGAESVTMAIAGYGTVALVTPDGTTRIIAANYDRRLGVKVQRRTVSLPFALGSSLVLHAHTPGCPSPGPSPDVLHAEITEARLFARGVTSQGAVCESLARALRCDNERDESVVLLVNAEEATATGDDPRRAFSGDRGSAAAARAFTLRTMDEWRLGGAANRAAAIVGELAANAIRHAGTRFEVQLHRRPGAVTVEVTDESRDLPRPVEAGPYDAGNRGLLIVETLAERWGVRTTDRGKSVWAELRIDSGTSRPEPPG